MMQLSDRALTTVEMVRVDLELEELDGNSYYSIVKMINAASDAIARFCNREFHYKEDITEKLAGQGGDAIVLAYTPILKIDYIKVDTSEIKDFEIDNKEAGIIYRQAGWPFHGGVKGFISADPYPGRESRNIEVKYSAGYVTPEQARKANENNDNNGDDEKLERTLPYDIEQSCIDTVKTWYHRRMDNLETTQENLMNEQHGYGRGRLGIPEAVKDLLRYSGWVRPA